MHPLLVIRTDAGLELGLGHAFRCLAIAQAWMDRKGRAMFLMARGGAFFRERLAREKIAFSVVEGEPGTRGDIEATLREASRVDADCILLDSYAFDTNFHEAIQASNIPCAVVDDHARLPRYVADVVIDVNVGSDEHAYNCRDDTRLIVGARYALVRRDFRTSERTRSRRATRRLLVSFGGSDPARLTSRVLKALDGAFETRVIVGAATSNVEEIRATAARQHNVALHVDEVRVAEQMAWADLALVATGGTCTELAYMGLPGIGVVVAENQRKVAQAFELLGSLSVLGDASNALPDTIIRTTADLMANDELRERMTRLGQAAIDGEGAGRVAEALFEVAL